MVARDTSCRPHEILGLRIKDIAFKKINDTVIAEIQVSGKTGPRSIPLYHSIPYVKDWLNDHPQKNNPNAFLIFSNGKAFGRKLSSGTMYSIYDQYKKTFFPKLLEDPKVSPEDKLKITELLKKPWNPYIRRHSALTDKSKILPEHVLRQHAGWSPNSNMPNIYIHYFGNEASNGLLEAYGIKPKLNEINKMQPLSCPNCKESNKVDAKFCVKCQLVLSYDAYQETIQKEQKKDAEILELRQEITRFNDQMKAFGSELRTVTSQMKEKTSNTVHEAQLLEEHSIQQYTTQMNTLKNLKNL
jgi:hypothetical protein